MKILAIETSCDETAAAIIENGTRCLSSAVASSSVIHKKYGGIVPELAARAQIQSIVPVITEALGIFRSANVHEPYLNTIKNNIDSIAVTIGPGLIGSLLVGVETAKTIAHATGIPIVPVNHVIAHMYANFIDFPVIPSGSEESLALTSSNKLRDSSATPQNDKIRFPAISLVVSGGHTELFLMDSETRITWLGGTLDDAAGEAFDKTARLLGFENRGGIAIQEAAQKYTDSCQLSAISKIIKLPRPYLPDKPYSFSFSGLKTATVRMVEILKKQKQYNKNTIQQCAFEIQESITDVLVKKTINVAKLHNVKSILISGGVASNTRLREKFSSSIYHFFAPPVSLCTDNALSIGACAHFIGRLVPVFDITAKPDLSVEIKI